MTMIAWILLLWLAASCAVAFFALCLIRGGTRPDEAADGAQGDSALEPIPADGTIVA
ncbi:MAG TPA: hypothetical protein VEL07_19130 [Planctomycetota bacterium]|nr:hypothetical protein [Planctomycetota bacterium]